MAFSGLSVCLCEWGGGGRGRGVVMGWESVCSNLLVKPEHNNDNVKRPCLFVKRAIDIWNQSIFYSLWIILFSLSTDLNICAAKMIMVSPLLQHLSCNYALGPVSLTVFLSQFKFYGNYVSLSSRFQYSDRYKILYMARQLCCRGMCQNL